MNIPQTATLIVIDVQKGFKDPAWGERNNPEMETKLLRLLEAWRKSKRPVVLVRHDSVHPQSTLHPSHPGNRFVSGLSPQETEMVIGKSVNSAFIGTPLEEVLRANGSTLLVIVGLTTSHCVSTTTRMAGNFGFEVLLPSDATATFSRLGPDGQAFPAQVLHEAELAMLHQEFCTVVSSDQILEAL